MSLFVVGDLEEGFRDRIHKEEGKYNYTVSPTLSMLIQWNEIGRNILGLWIYKEVTNKYRVDIQ